MIMILQRYNNLSDEQVEFQINDRMVIGRSRNISFMRFLSWIKFRITIADEIPDSRTVWHFQKRLTDLCLVESLFVLFLKELERLNLIVNGSKIIFRQVQNLDESFIKAFRQRNHRDENTQIKSGNILESYTANPHKLAQKDTDGWWAEPRSLD